MRAPDRAGRPATALRDVAGLPALSGARKEKYLASARHLGEPAIAWLWARGLAMTSDQAVAQALDIGPETHNTVALTALGADQVPTAPPDMLTPREREVVALVAFGRSNKAIAADLFISTATAARHVANILGKLGFNSRAQIAAWAADRPPHISEPGEDPPSVRQA